MLLERVKSITKCQHENMLIVQLKKQYSIHLQNDLIFNLERLPVNSYF